MGRLGVLPKSIGASHQANGTPHVAVTVMAALIFLVPVAMVTVFKLEVLDAFNDAGTFGAFGFLGAYFLISVAAPMFLKQWGRLTTREIVIPVASVVLLMVPAVGSVYPVPSWPVNIFPYIFLAYLTIGLVWFIVLRRRPAFADSIKQRIHSEHGVTAAQSNLARLPLEKPARQVVA
jgi:amino acid transporter